ncbi:MAG TPA: protein kinase [Kofleriaceae bacterium]|nr:protein kinase [Kofleriaceae bacterium]
MESRRNPTLLGGKYVLGELIGAGGMGLVYAATQPTLRRTVAIKILRAGLVDDERMVRHFRREALAGARVSHPGLVQVFELGEAADGRPFLAMEYVPGRLLGGLLRERPISLRRARDLVMQLLAALAEVHRAGIVHGDIKADNVMIETHHDGTDRVRLVDFGLAYITPAPGEAVDDPLFDDDLSVDAEGRCYVSGTPEYMAPEVISGGPVTVASDLYAVGILLYELLTGATPFAGDSPVVIIMRHLTDPVVPPSLRRPERYIPRELEDVVARALAKVPEARYPDAATFAAALAASVPDADVPLWCPDCGAPMPADGGACLACHPAVLELEADAPPEAPSAQAPDAHDQVPTVPWLLPPSHAPAPPVDDAPAPAQVEATADTATMPRPRLARGSRSEVEQRELDLRATIAEALVRGDRPAVIDGYRELASVLAGRGDRSGAIRELVEGIDIVTAGDDPAVLPAGSRATLLHAALAELRPRRVRLPRRRFRPAA